MPALSYQQPGMPGRRPGLVRRAQRSGGAAMSYRFNRIRRNITDGPWRSLGIAVSNALGVALSITIIAAADGIKTKIDTLTHANDNSGAAANAAAACGINVSDITNVLSQTRSLLTVLAIIFTAAIVGMVTWITTSQRRRSISLEIQSGQRRNDLIAEFVGEAFVLCVSGGVLGIVLGILACNIIGAIITLLPMSPSFGGIAAIFPTTTLLAFLATSGIAAYFAANTDTRTQM